MSVRAWQVPEKTAFLTNFNTTLVSVRAFCLHSIRINMENFNTTLVSVRAYADALAKAAGGAFQYNSCVGSRRVCKRYILVVRYFNTTLVSVRVARKLYDGYNFKFQYNSCVGSRV